VPAHLPFARALTASREGGRRVAAPFVFHTIRLFHLPQKSKQASAFPGLSAVSGR